MQTRLWMAGAATVALVSTGVLAAHPLVQGESAVTPIEDAGQDVPKQAPGRDIEQIVEKALEQAGIRNGQFDIDVRQMVEQATRAAQDAVKDVDVKVIVDDAMQELGDLAGGDRLRIGVRARDVTADEAKAAGLPGIAGAFVVEVPAESPGAKGGLQVNDIILTVDGETVRSARQLSRVVAESPDGKALQVSYVRGATRGTATVTPERPAPRRMTMRGGGEGPMVHRFERRVGPGGPEGPGNREQFDVFVTPPPGEGQERQFFYRRGPEGDVRIRTSRGRLGVIAQPLTPQLATYFGAKAGVLVSQVNENTPAAKAGIKAGDVITSVNGKPVADVGDIIENLEGVADGKAVPVEIVRDKKAQTIQVTLQAPAATSGDRVVTRSRRFTA
ncbi:hypothetical protein TBR22_A52360 [Luteitalea sp. TBR-22]|uniref:PDZ domain-containing protein n=1 Tax=Luteitalea sp. TBR-22 TaxID=2802971 RepID=UPI001AFCB8AF|nr:PDZ domain-containing protein [Luteitalea sp. TBR-22]BCS35999.1 hypothetical protein TBR22_A52360 [Luteitalea sp. TBR-22]